MTEATLIAVTGASQTAALGYAFALGLVGVANPCGLPLLPAYLSFFVGNRGALLGRAVRALVSSACVTAGFVTCFGVVGLALGGVVAEVESTLPPLMIAAGAAMAVLGVLTATGRHVPLVRLPRGLAVSNRGPLSMAAFGVFYALASLGCSLPVFIAAVGGSLDRSGMWVVFRSCVAYSLGMGLLLAVIALSGAT
ncbi:MAG: cytochrome c biogenesis CcdA family protein, partial [Acidimicrobiales bacterium]